MSFYLVYFSQVELIWDVNLAVKTAMLYQDVIVTDIDVHVYMYEYILGGHESKTWWKQPFLGEV